MLRVWDVESGKIVLGPIQTGYGNVYATVYSPDTTKIATGGDSENGIKIWDATTGKLLSTVELFEAVWSLVWTSDQKKLISGSVLGPVRIFNTATWQQIAILQGHESPILTISLFRSDRFLGSASYDKTARLWDLDTNLPVGPPLQHKELVDGAAISADGKLLVAGCMDRNAYIWDIQTILTEAGIEDLLCTTNVAAKSLMDIDATRLRAQREHARQVPRGFFDDRQDGVHLNTDESIELQQPPPRSAVSGHSPHAIDVAAVRDKEALYVARRPERTSEQATRIENPTWWTRCILFICCVSTQRTEGHQ
ncbi:WD40 repeat-like protein [Rhizopogon salebrosus TDB-379]|nr:WD40 repeat-like protein [Rhizopogon salebrosus TDB-379]